MERQQLLKSSEKSAVVNPSDKNGSSKLRTPFDRDQLGSLSQKSTQSARLDRYEAKSSLMTVFSDIFSKKSSRNHSIMCDVIVTCFVVLNCFLLLTSCGVGATPVISEKQLSTYHLIPSGRNIRHLPCVSRRTKEEGVCMFAIDCLKANGTHLGTCIDRFYFGSCCQIPDYIDTSINDNNIEDNTIFGKPIQEPVLKEGELYVSSSPAITSGRPPTTVKFPSSISEAATHYITKKPITAGSHTTTYIKFPTTNQNKITQTGVKTTKKPVALAANKTEEKVQPQIIPSLKPTRHNTTVQDKYQTTTTRTTLQSSRPTKTSIPTTSTIQTTIYINNQLYNASKPATTAKKPITTTEIPPKLSTYQSVQVATKTTTQKTTTFTFASKKPSQRPVSNLPFGTRLPSTTPGPSKPTTTKTVSINTSTRANATTTQRPTTKLKPERTTTTSTPTPTPTTKSTIRPTVQRPINSTLSNRRTTTTKPTTIFKRPTTVSPSTTLIYKPFTSSLKPSSSQKPTTLTQKPTTIYKKPTIASTTPKANVTVTVKTTVKPKITTTIKPTRRPINVTQVSTTTTTTTTPKTTTPKTNFTTTTSFTKYNYSSTTVTKPTTVSKPTQSTRRPTVKPTPTTTPKPKITTTPSPLTNEIDAPLGAKPTLDIKKTTTTTTTTTTTEKIGLVTWTNYVETAVTGSPIPNSTLKDQDWTAVSPTDGWVLLSTVSPHVDNATTTKVTTEAPKATTTIVTTTIPSSTASTTKLTTTLGLINETKFENTTTTPTTDQEFTTFMLVSGGTVDYNITTVIEESKINATTVSPISDGNLTVSNATLTVDNDTLSTTEMSVNGTALPDDTQSTEKSTVSPIEIFTSTGTPTAESVNMTDYTDVCGRRLWPEARIVGGARSSFGRWPWQISLRQWRTSTYLHKCGAALLNENWAITAAHCVDSVPPSDLLLRLGEHDLANEEEPYGFQERRVQIVASHPQFDPRTFEYDLALLRFYEPVTFQPNILPVCVPTDDDGFIGKTAYVTGWGRLYEDGPLPSVLQEVSVPVIENAICESMYRSAGYIEHIPNIFICAGWRKGGFDSCEGDSGGPMVLQRADKRFLLAGVISWGIGCAEPNQPGVYTRISQFRHWINQILQF